MEVYPDAKILLNVRDPETWYESIRRTVYQVSHGAAAGTGESPAAGTAHVIETLAWQGLFNGRFEDKDYAISVYERHNQEVKDAVPADKLLVWEVKEGWEPLCRFLNVDAPGTPFPRLNDAETFRQRFMP